MATDAAAATDARDHAIPAWIWLVWIVTLSAGFRYGLSRRMVAPWIMVDELLYSELAKSFGRDGHFAVREVAEHGLGFVYPALIAPAYRFFGSVPDAYSAAKAINSVVMSLAAAPAYLLARRVVSRRLALVVAGLTVAVPSMVYSGTLMTENAFYPLFLFVALALVDMLERPTRGNQILVLGLCALAFATRAQAIALVPAVLTAPILFERRRPDAFGWLYGLTGAAVVLVGGYELARGRSLTSVFGVYRAATDSHYDVATSLRWIVWHVAELDLYVGVAPFAALIVLTVMMRTLWSREQAFVAAALSLSAWLVVEVGVFASVHSGRIEERNMFYLAPLFFVALVLWIEREMPRGRLAAVAAIVSAALVGAIPFASLIGESARSDTLALLPWWSLQDSVLTLDQVASVAVLGAAAVAILFLLVPARWVLALPAVLAGYFALSLWAIETNPHGGVHAASLGALYGGITNPQRDWVDRTVGANANVAFVWSGDNDKRRFTLYENEFFNRSVRRVYDLGAPAWGNLPSTKVSVDRRTGVLVGAGPAQYVLTDDRVRLDGAEVARDAVKGMVLYRVSGPLRLADSITGVNPVDTWSGATATYTRYDCEGGSVTALLQSDGDLFPRGQVVSSAGRSVRVPPDGKATLTVPLRARDGVCTARFDVSPTAIPAVVLHNADTRVLGIHVSRFVFQA